MTMLLFRSKPPQFIHYKDTIGNVAFEFDIPIHKPWFELTKHNKQLVWKGNKNFKEFNHFFTN